MIRLRLLRALKTQQQFLVLVVLFIWLQEFFITPEPTFWMTFKAISLPTCSTLHVVGFNESVKKLVDWNFDLCAKLNKFHEEKTESNIPSQKNKEQKTVKPFKAPRLKKKLFPYQEDGIKFVEENNGRALIADEMGLGKTVQAIGYVQLHPELRPAIIVCPASLKENWKKELKIWTGDVSNVNIISGTKIKQLTNNKDITIINYDIVRHWEKAIIKTKPEIIILDECHYIKTMQTKSQRSKAVINICKKTKHIIALSGTPIINRPSEFFNIINIIDKTLFSSRMAYHKKHCDPKHNGFAWTYNGASNIKKLNKTISGIMIRRLKKDVLKDLPDKTRTIIPLKIDNQNVYNTAKLDIIKWIKINKGKDPAERAKKIEALSKIENLKQIVVAGKIKQCIKFIENFVESDQKLVIFTTHKKTLQELNKVFKKISVVLDGSTPPKQRQKVVDSFQNDNHIKLFFGNIKAAGVGITLVAASNVCFVEFPWTPGELEQASDRCHRIGQKDNVNAYYLVAQNTIEEDIISLLSKKQKILNAVLEGKDVKEIDIFGKLMNTIEEGN